MSYAGLNPRVHQSDERRRGGKITKAGRSQLRWLMTEVAWAHVHADGPEAHHYHRLVARGKPKSVAITALARRLLVLAYLLLRRECPYRELDRSGWHRKLTKLAARRRPAEPRPAGEVRHVDWAWARCEAITGEPRPEQNKGGRPRKAAVVPPTTVPAAGEAGEPAAAPRDGTGAPTPGESTARAWESAPPAGPPAAEDTVGVRPPGVRLPTAPRGTRVRGTPCRRETTPADTVT